MRAFPPPASGQGGQWQISNSGVAPQSGPMWSRTGHDLLYQSGDQIMAASYTVKGDYVRGGQASSVAGEAGRRDGIWSGSGR